MNAEQKVAQGGTPAMMEKLAQKNKAKLIDLLNERLTFERSGVRLYDTILKKMESAGSMEGTRLLDEMREHRDQEKEHEEWLEECIRSLGGDAHGETEMSKLVERESQGIEKVVQEDSELPHLFHALLAAELVDNAGWDLLVQLADEAGDRQAKKEFRKRLNEEAEHLVVVRRALEKNILKEVLQQDQPGAI
jgi:ferritin-like metal-binding protein YciE